MIIVSPLVPFTCIEARDFGFRLDNKIFWAIVQLFN